MNFGDSEKLGNFIDMDSFPEHFGSGRGASTRSTPVEASSLAEESTAAEESTGAEASTLAEAALESMFINHSEYLRALTSIYLQEFYIDISV